MINFIDYFYGFKINDIKNGNKYYSFIYKEYLYKLYLIDRNIDINTVVNINKYMVGRTLISKIIVNKSGTPISRYKNNSYVLVKVYASGKRLITLEEIVFLSSSLHTNKINHNWGELWSKKIDYLENLISEFGKKYPIIVDSFNYFVGMAENAISYFNSINLDNNFSYYISHKILQLDEVIDSIYNPLNIIFDYKVRDMAEYIKKAFFLNNKNIYNVLVKYIDNNNLTIIDIKLLVARLLYPSFYFELYEDILIDKKDEKIIIDIVKRMDEYEKYLAWIIELLAKKYDIEQVEWLKRT